jgi:hypothetical protein
VNAIPVTNVRHVILGLYSFCSTIDSDEKSTTLWE